MAPFFARVFEKESLKRILIVIFSRAYLKTGNMTNSEGFFAVQTVFRRDTGRIAKTVPRREKEPLFGRLSSFQMRPKYYIDILAKLR